MRNDYEILGVSAGADQKEIKRAYFKLVRQFSPEKDPERFQEIRGAYERLTQGEEQEKAGIRLSMEMSEEPFAQRMFQQIIALERQREYEGAAETAKEAIRLFGEYEAFLYELAGSQLRGGHSGSAVKNFEKLVKRYPEKAPYKRELAIAYMERGYGNKAFRAFEEAYAAGVRDNDFILQFSLCCRDREEEDRGTEVLLEMVRGYDGSSREDAQDYLEAYTGIFSMNRFAPTDKYGEFLELYRGFLNTAGRALRDCGDMVMDMALFLVKSFNIPEYLSVLNEVLEAAKRICPERKYSNEWKHISESLLETRLHIDERLDEEWSFCFEAYVTGDDFYDKSILRFMQLDCRLILLERREELASQFEIIKTEYSELYEKMEGFFKLLTQEDIPRTMERMRSDYRSMDKKISGGRYYEFYPQYRPRVEKVQWDSFENGSYVRMGRKVGSNDPCPCGSGKKYKKCCGK